MKLLATAAVWLLALAGAAEAAEPAPAPPISIAPPPLEPPGPPPPPVSEALFQRFLASLPKEAWAGPATVAPETAKRLVELNPGKEAQIASILGAFDRCSEPAAAAGMRRTYQIAMGSPVLGAAKVERMTEFFSSGGWAALTLLNIRINASATPAAADVAEKDRLIADYPLDDFSASLTIAGFAALKEGAFAALKTCEADRDSALAKAGIKPTLKSLTEG